MSRKVPLVRREQGIAGLVARRQGAGSFAPNAAPRRFTTAPGQRVASILHCIAPRRRIPQFSRPWRSLVAHVPAAAPAVGWIRHRDFDLRFIAGTATLAILAGCLVVAKPRIFGLVLAIDLWLVACPHVIATFTRLCFDPASFREQRFLLVGLPPLVLAVTAGLFLAVGPWLLVSIYFYWQFFHYTRQSHGVAKIYARRAALPLPCGELLERLTFAALPVWGVLARSHQAPTVFLGSPFRCLPVPSLAVDIAGAVALASIAVWLGTRAVAAWHGRLPLAHTLYILSHHAVFFTSTIAIEDATHGWLVLNLWHNLQYLLFTWLYNEKRHAGGVDPSARLLSWLAQPGRGPLFFGICLALSTAVYGAIQLAVGGLAIAVVVYQTINFHHYIVDGLIWKVRSPKLRSTLGLAGTG